MPSEEDQDKQKPEEPLEKEILDKFTENLMPGWSFIQAAYNFLFLGGVFCLHSQVFFQ